MDNRGEKFVSPPNISTQQWAVQSMYSQQVPERQIVNNEGIAAMAMKRMAESSRHFATTLFEGRLIVYTSGGKVPPRGQMLDIHLDTLRSVSNIARVDVKMLNKHFQAGKNLIKSVDRVIKNKIFLDWILLKCEAMQINFTDKQENIEIYSLSDFKLLKHLILKSTVFPLPFIYNDPETGTRYFYATYSGSINKPVSKLNSRIFYDAEGKEVLVTCDVGIKLESQYMGRIKKFKISVGKQNVKYVSQHLLAIKRLITYNHILFGFLQDWIKRLHLDYCKNYTMDQIAMQLTLHKESVEEVRRKLNGAPGRTLPYFFVQSFPDCALYLRFTGSITSQFSFEIENIETPIVSTISIVQYYRQFFYINDETKSNALKCLLDYSSGNKNFLQVRDVIEYRNVEYRLNVETLSVPKAIIKARTVEEINRGYEIQKEAEKPPEKKAAEPERKEKEPEKRQTNEDDLMNIFNNPGDKFMPEWLPLVRKALDECFEQNPVEFLSEDEFNDTSIIIQKFQEAVNRADKTGSVRIFLEQVYNNLQLSFTNATCKTIMNCMIYNELKSRCEAENNSGQGERGLSELVRNPAKRKGDANEDEPRLKMPTLMPLTKFLKLEKHRHKDRNEKDLTPCSVVLKKVSLNSQDKDESEENAEEDVEEIPVAEPQNYMVKFSEGFVVNSRKRMLSEDRSSSHSETEPSKTKDYWREEKLYRECMTSKTKVVLRRLEDKFGCKNFNKTVKLKRRKTSSSSSDLTIPYDCFEVSEGKVKLKPGFECRDGYIVPKNISPPSSPSSYRSSDSSIGACRFSVYPPWLKDSSVQKNFPTQLKTNDKIVSPSCSLKDSTLKNDQPKTESTNASSIQKNPPASVQPETREHKVDSASSILKSVLPSKIAQEETNKNKENKPFVSSMNSPASRNISSQLKTSKEVNNASASTAPANSPTSKNISPQLKNITEVIASASTVLKNPLAWKNISPQLKTTKEVNNASASTVPKNSPASKNISPGLKTSKEVNTSASTVLKNPLASKNISPQSITSKEVNNASASTAPKNSPASVSIFAKPETNKDMKNAAASGGSKNAPASINISPLLKTSKEVNSASASTVPKSSPALKNNSVQLKTASASSTLTNSPTSKNVPTQPETKKAPASVDLKNSPSLKTAQSQIDKEVQKASACIVPKSSTPSKNIPFQPETNKLLKNVSASESSKNAPSSKNISAQPENASSSATVKNSPGLRNVTTQPEIIGEVKNGYTSTTPKNSPASKIILAGPGANKEVKNASASATPENSPASKIILAGPGANKEVKNVSASVTPKNSPASKVISIRPEVNKEVRNDSASGTPMPPLKNISNQVKNAFASLGLKTSPASGTISVQSAINKEVENALASPTAKNSPSSKSAQPEQPVSSTRNDIPPLKDVQIKVETRNEDKPVSEPEVLVIDDSDEIEIVEVKKLENPPPGRIISCGLCLQEFQSIITLEEHEKSNHRNEVTYQCTVCRKRFYKLPFLELHRKVKHDKSLSCEYCNITLKDTKELEDHLLGKKHEERRLGHVVVLEV